MKSHWTTITEGMLRSRLSGVELHASRTANTSPGDPDPIQCLIEQVTDKVRGAVAAGGRNLGRDGEIPRVLLFDALSILVVAVQLRANGVMLDESDARKQAADRAERILEDVARGDGPSIPEPEVVDATEPPDYVPMQFSSNHEETFRRDQQEGF